MHDLSPIGQVLEPLNGRRVPGANPLHGGTEGGPAMLRRRLGAELRRLREARSLRLEDVAVALGLVPSALSRIETGKAPVRTSYVYLMLDIYGIDDPEHRCALVDIAREGQRKSWWARHADILPPGAVEYLGLEAAAT
jgi:transcriptional regulator with XRE-family HTH domain